ncbi:hypothetical protein TWF102_001434 [Orbilia oligospora]|uniref:Uncharacterized protein n=1 Tax=Orbilia oligospora TaxID=2813651 RepID=A0A7C8JPU7_ORBOL|nr:hypothetical protein TWF102_001434 [Orbilia oligospora]
MLRYIIRYHQRRFKEVLIPTAQCYVHDKSHLNQFHKSLVRKCCHMQSDRLRSPKTTSVRTECGLHPTRRYI